MISSNVVAALNRGTEMRSRSEEDPDDVTEPWVMEGQPFMELDVEESPSMVASRQGIARDTPKYNAL